MEPRTTWAVSQIWTAAAITQVSKLDLEHKTMGRFGTRSRACPLLHASLPASPSFLFQSPRCSCARTCEPRPARRSASYSSWAQAKPLVVTATYNRKWGLRGKLGLFFQVFRPITREKFSSLSNAPTPPNPNPPTLKLLSSVERSSSTFNLALLILSNNSVCSPMFIYLFI